MVEENLSQECRLKKIDETKTYFTVEINQNDLLSKKHNEICTNWNYIKHLLILASVVTKWVSVFASTSLIGIPIEITSSVVGLKIYAITQ